jgi:hypothetical protein
VSGLNILEYVCTYVTAFIVDTDFEQEETQIQMVSQLDECTGKVGVLDFGLR